MFQIAHAHIASRVSGRRDTATTIGAILPDASITGLKTYLAAVVNPNGQAASRLDERITFYDMHPLARARALMASMRSKPVAMGILTHALADTVSHGGDDVSRENYNWRHPTAYSFGGEHGWWGSRFPRLQVNSYARGMFLHNVAEGMLDRYVAKTYPEDVGLLLGAIRYVDVRRLSADLAQALGKDPPAIEKRVREYLRATKKFVRRVQRLPHVNPAGMEDVLETCVQRCREEMAGKTI